MNLSIIRRHAIDVGRQSVARACRRLASLNSAPYAKPGGEKPCLTILDIGAQPIKGEEDVFRPLLDGGNCTVIGFEPIEETHGERLNRDPDWRLFPHFAGDGTSRRFYRTDYGPTSSLYEPNLEAIADFEGLAEICQVAGSEDIETVRLDDVIHERVDLLKIDVQGAELDVLRGAQRLLDDLLVIHAEVEFFAIYKAQPLFDAVFGFLVSRGFELFDLPRLVRYSYQGTGYRLERLLWAEAVFVPDRQRLEQLDPEAAHRLARILHDVYGAVGFVEWFMRLKGLPRPPRRINL